MAPHDQLTDEYGSGIDGIVYASSRSTAIKAITSQERYFNELNAYKRLRQHGVYEICGHSVPQLIDFDNHLKVIEMTTVQPPFVVDFGKAHVDHQPDFEADNLAIWRQNVLDAFGEKAKAAFRIHQVLWDNYGIYYPDLSTRNIMFEDED